MSDSPKKPPEGTPPDLQEFLKQLKDRVGVFSFPMDAAGFGGGQAPAAAEPAESAESEEPRDPIPESVRAFALTPKQVKAHLDRFVIGQDEAKRTLSVAICDHYNHVRRSLARNEAVDKGAKDGEVRGSGDPEYVKQNVILLGPTGVGKTYLLRILAQLIGVPFVKADVTKFSETGYVGQDVDDLVRELVRVADGDVDLAEHGIIFLDEVDKIASAQSAHGRDPSGRGVQVGLLKLMEDTEVSLRNPMDIGAQFQEMMQAQRGSKRARRSANTRHVLFVVSGAFSGLGDIIAKRLSESSVGFRALLDGAANESRGNPLARVATQDFVEYGFEPEFIGRLPVRVALDELEADDLYEILTTSEGSILRQYRQSFLDFGLRIAFEDAALRGVAERAAEEKTGARGLMSVLESTLRDLKFELPGGPVKELAMTTATLDDPKATLEEILASPEKSAALHARIRIEEFEMEFARRHGVRLRLDDEAIDMAQTLAKELSVEIHEYLERRFAAHAEFLARVQAESGRDELPVSPRVLSNPGQGLEAWFETGAAVARPTKDGAH